MGEPSAASARVRKSLAFLATRRVLVPTASTASGGLAEPLAEAREGLQGPLLRLLGEPLVGRQAGGEPDRLARESSG